MPINTKPVLTSADRLEFQTFLEGAAANPDLCVIANRFPWQARMASEKLLTVAKEKKAPIRILTGAGRDCFYTPEYTAKLAECKKAGSPYIKILVWQPTANGISPSLLKLTTDGTVDLRITGTLKFSDKIPHFLLVDNYAFRQEASHTPFTKDTVFTDMEPQVPARIDFKDVETGKSLAALFDSLWGTA